MGCEVLFFCTGNTCRSPLVEVIAQKQFAGLDVGFSSAGLAAVAGQGASQPSQAVAREMGLDLAGHRSRLVDPDTLAKTAWLIGMTRSHAAIFKSRFGDRYDGAIGVLGAPGLNLALTRFSTPCVEVDDPFGGHLDAYRRMGQQVTDLLADWTPIFHKLG